MPRFHRVRDCHGQYVVKMCGDPGFVPAVRAKGIQNCRRRASDKLLKVSNIFRRTLGAESTGLEKIPSQSPAVTLSGGGEVRSPAPNACKSAALGTARSNSEKVQKHELAVQGVWSEPVSGGWGPNSLLNREKTGNFCKFAREWPILMA